MLIEVDILWILKCTLYAIMQFMFMSFVFKLFFCYGRTKKENILVVYVQIVCDQHGPPGKTRRPLPPSPPRQKYLEIVKKVKKTTKSAIFMKICNMYIIDY